jgi:hypothetical protein
MWTDYITLMTMAVLLRLSYELSSPEPTVSQTSTNPNAGPLTSQQKEWAEKAVRRYAEAQEKKWRHWNEAMFEAKQS